MKEFTVSVFTENKVGLLNRVTVVLTRRHINIESLTVSESEVEGIHRFTIVINVAEDQVKKIVKQMEKQVDVVKAFYHETDETVHQEIALYKMPISALSNGLNLEKMLRHHHARILSVSPEFLIVEKTGHKAETQELFNQLQPLGLLEFVRSGRIAITKPMKKFSEHMEEMHAF